jgi:hypothetical protein
VNGTWSNGASNGIFASLADWKALLDDLSEAITQSVAKDGQTAFTSDLQMGGNKLTGLAKGSAVGDSLAWEQLFSQGVETDIASAATLNIGAQNSNFLRVTGTTTITSFGTDYNGPRYLRFAGAVTLTNSSTLVLPGNTNFTTSAGDVIVAIPKATAGTPDGWYVVSVPSSISQYVTLSGTETLTNKTLTNPVINGMTGNTAVINFGSGQFYKDASGNLGIGTSSPGAKFEISSTGASGRILLNGADLPMITNGFDKFTSGAYSGAGRWGMFMEVGQLTMGCAPIGSFTFKHFNADSTSTERARIDSSGNLLVTGGGALGYGAGSGGTVTQATSKTTAVTLNKSVGRIVMNSAALAANTNVNFQLNNSLITQSDTLVCSIQEATGGVVYTVQAYCGTGFAQILVRNTGGSSLSEAVAINFAIIKGAIS